MMIGFICVIGFLFICGIYLDITNKRKEIEHMAKLDFFLEDCRERDDFETYFKLLGIKRLDITNKRKEIKHMAKLDFFLENCRKRDDFETYFKLLGIKRGEKHEQEKTKKTA